MRPAILKGIDALKPVIFLGIEGVLSVGDKPGFDKYALANLDDLVQKFPTCKFWLLFPEEDRCELGTMRDLFVFTALVRLAGGGSPTTWCRGRIEGWLDTSTTKEFGPSHVWMKHTLVDVYNETEEARPYVVIDSVDHGLGDKQVITLPHQGLNTIARISAEFVLSGKPPITSTFTSRQDDND